MSSATSSASHGYYNYEATATAEHPPSGASKSNARKRALEEEEDEQQHRDAEYDEEEQEDSVNDLVKKYHNLAVYGEHKRAVSSVKLAPSRLTKNRSDRHCAIAASASADGTCKIWDLGSLQMEFTGPRRQPLQASNTCVGHTRGINCVAWNPVSPLLATASDDKTVRLWDAVTSEALVELRNHDNFVFCVDQSIRNMVVTGSFDETVKLWDIRTGDCVSTLPAHSDPVTAVCFNRDGTVVASASHDGLIRIWDVATSECLKTIYAAGNPPVSSVTYAPNSKYVLANTLDSTLRLWPVTTTTTTTITTPTTTNNNSNTGVTGGTISGSSNNNTNNTNNNCAAAAGGGATKTYRSKHFVNSKYSVVADFTATGDVVVGSETGEVVVFDLQSGHVQQTLQGHTDAVLAVSAHDTLPLICSGAMTTDRRVEFWSQDYVPDATTTKTKTKTKKSSKSNVNNSSSSSPRSNKRKQQ